jgi:hypothetical protein
MSIVRENLMTRPHYRPYCGRDGKCPSNWPRTVFVKDQFECPACGFRTEFEPEFIEQYKVKALELARQRPPQLSDFL